MPGTGVLSEVKARQIPRRIMVNREDAEREMAITQSGEVRFLTVAQRSSAKNILDFRVNISLAFLISPAIRSLLETDELSSPSDSKSLYCAALSSCAVLPRRCRLKIPSRWYVLPIVVVAVVVLAAAFLNSSRKHSIQAARANLLVASQRYPEVHAGATCGSTTRIAVGTAPEVARSVADGDGAAFGFIPNVSSKLIAAANRCPSRAI